MDSSRQQHTLTGLIDREVYAFVPMLRKDGLVTIKIRNVEEAGLWIENGDLKIGVSRDSEGRHVEIEDMPPTVVFIPWPQLGYVISLDAGEIRKGQLLHFSPNGSTENQEQQQ